MPKALTLFTRVLVILGTSLLIAACNPTLTPAAATATLTPSPSPDLPSTPLASSIPSYTPTATVPPFPRLSTRSSITAPLPELILDVELFYSERWMRVHQSLNLTNPTAESWGQILFSIPLNAVPEAFYLDSVTTTLDGISQDQYPSLEAGQTILRVALPRLASPNERIQLEMRYRVLIPPLESSSWPPIGTTGWTLDLIQAGDWYPSLIPYFEGQGWQTWDYHPVGDPTFYPLINARMTITTEPDVIIASGGLVGQGDGKWHFDLPAARGIAFLASNRYEVVEGEAIGLPVRSYYLPEHAQAGRAALEVATNSLTLFDELYGPYPYDSLVVAENAFFGGMEYSALASISGYAYVTYIGQPASPLYALVAHETAHQWWYGAVGNDQPNEPWLDESLAFYSEYLYFERYHPDFKRWWWERRVDWFNPSGPVDATIYDYDTSSDFMYSVYGRAAHFIHDLRILMGNDAFFAFLHDYCQTYQGQIVTANDFFTTLQRHTDADLTPLLDEYFSPDSPPFQSGEQAKKTV